MSDADLYELYLRRKLVVRKQTRTEAIRRRLTVPELFQLILYVISRQTVVATAVLDSCVRVHAQVVDFTS
jgi:hypothetical protein